VDVTDQREVSDGFTFIELEGERLPFSDRSFDVVVSNHVIEHVRDANMHLSEIWRVLKDDGLVYLATPNRFWPWEAHNMIPLLHYFPPSIFNYFLKLLGRHHEDVYLLTWWALQRKMKRLFYINIVSDRICKWPLKYHMQCHPFVAKILSWIPLRIYRIFTFINPTLVVMLKK
jgi:SAM-dependent methyltransferase